MSTDSASGSRTAVYGSETAAVRVEVDVDTVGENHKAVLLELLLVGAGLGSVGV